MLRYVYFTPNAEKVNGFKEKNQKKICVSPEQIRQAATEEKKMTVEEVKKIIDNGGATLDGNGRAVSFRRGYQVSRRDCYTLNAEHIAEIAGALNDVLHRCKGQANSFCGVWVDAGEVYIDISERITNRKKALSVGRARHQISVYDWNSGNCIYC